MKRTKKLLALVLALAMAFTTLVIPAAAHGDEDEGIMPLYEVGRCPKCGQYGQVVRESYSHTYQVSSCRDRAGTHNHTETVHSDYYPECNHTDYYSNTKCG